MKNTIKMSLVAAVAVAGLSTTASAAPLEESIKNTDLSGYLRYRLDTNDSQLDSLDSTQSNEIKAVYNFKTKVNDNVTAHVKFVGVYTNADNANGANATEFDINQANFIYQNGPATAIVGLQTAQSPFVANNGDTRANGITALYNAGVATIAAAHYTDVHAGSTQVENDVTALGVIGSMGPVNAEAWFATASGEESNSATVGSTSPGADYFAILASANVGPVTISAHHATEDQGTSAADDIENTQVVVSGKVETVSLYAGYVTTGKDGGDVTMDGDDDSKLIFALEQISSQQTDADVWAIGASAPVGPVTLAVDYADAEIGTNTDADELLLTVSHKMSKNLNIKAYYSDYEVTAAGTTTTENEKTRLEVKYSF
jgi:hypothetical protein